MELNKNQMDAVCHKTGPMMVLAGPGSGKTTVIIHRIKYLIDHMGIDPSEILVITFTKAASVQMKKRAEKIIGPKAHRLNISTFHAFFYRLLKAHTNIDLVNILTDEERFEIIRGILEKEEILTSQDRELVDEVSSEISLFKNDMLDIKYYNSMSLSSRDFNNVLTLYEDYKKTFKKLDFDDMLEKCYKLLSENPSVLKIWKNKYSHILIDEFQDISRIQYCAIKLILNEEKNIYIVGDDDQSIYRFRGARPEFLLNFPKEFENCSRAVLNTNYRSSEEIIKLSNKIIAKNKLRYDKTIIGTGKQGPAPKFILTEDAYLEGLFIAKKILSHKEDTQLSNIAVLYRTKIQARAVAEALLSFKIPFQLKDEIPHIYEHWIAKDLYAYMKLAVNRLDDSSLARIINKPNRYISSAVIAGAKKSKMNLIDYIYSSGQFKQWQLGRIEEMMFYLNALKNRSPYEGIKYIRSAIGYDDYIKDYCDYKKMNPKNLYEMLNEIQDSAKGFESYIGYLEHIEKMIEENRLSAKAGNNQENGGVILSTMHSAKGLEFDIIFLISCVEGIIPYEKSKTEAQTEEERRLFYVGLTRAKQYLYISMIKKRYEKEVDVSSFLDGIVKLAK